MDFCKSQEGKKLTAAEEIPYYYTMQSWRLIFYFFLLSLVILLPLQLIYANNPNLLNVQNILILLALILFFYYFSRQLHKQQTEQIAKHLKYSAEELAAEEWMRREYAPGILSRFKQHSVKIVLYGSFLFFILYLLWLIFLHIGNAQLQLLFYYVIPFTYICLAVYLYIIFNHYDIFSAQLNEKLSCSKKLHWLIFLNSDQMKMYLILLPGVLIASNIYAFIAGNQVNLLTNLITFSTAYLLVCSVIKMMTGNNGENL
jgi:hypothetical protein